MTARKCARQISTREMQVLENISHGFSIKEITQKLQLSNHTIISHRKNLRTKLKATNSPELVRRGFQLGYLSP